MTRTKTAQNNDRSLLTTPLGLRGWDALEPVLLAAVASETPLLLVGSHGCAKSYFLEKLARALGLTYRFYNASLINYDDLVGIPIPSDDRTRLDYIASPTAIWDAEVVFMDEINRTKPELQSKLFPIIHERRVQGIDLKKLRFRWAAMNPVSPTDDYDENAYLGAEPLDTALADRFGFIVEVPAWNDLSRNEKLAVLNDNTVEAPPFPRPIGEVIGRCRHRLDALIQKKNGLVKDYLLILADELNKVDVHLSTRRMTMLLGNIFAVRAAGETLSEFRKGNTQMAWSDVLWTALQNSLPQRAEGAMPDFFKLSAAHMQAWALAKSNTENRDDQWLLTLSCPVERVVAAVRLTDSIAPETLSAAITEFIYTGTGPEEQGARALALYVATQHVLAIPVEALDAMAAILDGILTPAPTSVNLNEQQRDYLTELNQDVHHDCASHERLLQYYDKRLEIWIYRQKQSQQCGIEARRHFREMLKKLQPATAAAAA